MGPLSNCPRRHSRRGGPRPRLDKGYLRMDPVGRSPEHRLPATCLWQVVGAASDRPRRHSRPGGPVACRTKRICVWPCRSKPAAPFASYLPMAGSGPTVQLPSAPFPSRRSPSPAGQRVSAYGPCRSKPGAPSAGYLPMAGSGRSVLSPRVPARWEPLVVGGRLLAKVGMGRLNTAIVWLVARGGVSPANSSSRRGRRPALGG